MSEIPSECRTVKEIDQIRRFVRPDLGPSFLQRLYQQTTLAGKDISFSGFESQIPGLSLENLSSVYTCYDEQTRHDNNQPARLQKLIRVFKIFDTK